MELDFRTLDASNRYKLLTALVVPRPIAWISTLNESGTVNVAPYSFFNVLGNAPPVVGIGVGSRPDGSQKDTRRNIERQGQFVINLVDRSVASVMHQTAAPYPPEQSETAALSIATESSFSVEPPRIVASKVHLECRYAQTVELENNRIVLGFIEHVHVVDGLVDPETYRVEPGAFNGVGRLQGPGWYCNSDDSFDLGRFPKAPK